MNCRFKSLLLAGTVVLVAGCDQKQSESQATANTDYQKQLVTQLINAKPGDVIDIPAGTYAFNRGLSLTVDGVTLRGQGMDKTILSFKDQIQGAEGLFVRANDFTIEDLAIEDAKGDALKVNEGRNIVIRRVRTEWTNGPDEKNGAYGIYPVQTENTLIDGAVAIGAADAGIYVGQSKRVIVRNSRAEFNVAGIEIEHTQFADVYDNVAVNNTGGILVFNMPNLPQPGFGTRVFNNIIKTNNTKNFAPKGAIVASVPAGSGIVINSNDQVEIFDNEMSDNKTAHVIISSYFTTGYVKELEAVKDFDAYPESIFIYNNTYGPGGNSPDHLDLKALKLMEFGLNGHLPEVLWDGYVDEAKLENGALPSPLKICVQEQTAGIINVDAPGGFKNISTDIAPHECELPKLEPVALQGALANL